MAGVQASILQRGEFAARGDESGAMRQFIRQRLRAHRVPEGARITLKRMMRRLEIGDAREMRAQDAIIFGAPCFIAGAVGGIGGKQMHDTELQSVKRETMEGIEKARRVAEGDDIGRPWLRRDARSESGHSTENGRESGREK